MTTGSNLLIVTAGLAFVANAGTVAWYRFEGGTPGATVPSGLVNSVAGSEVPSLTAFSINGTTFGLDSAYMPKYIDGFSAGAKILDPVTGNSYVNTSSLRMRESYVKTPAQSGGAYLNASDLPCGGSFTMECFFRITETDPSVVTNLAMAPILTFQAGGYTDSSIQLYYGKFYGRITAKDSEGTVKSSQAVTGKSAVLDGKWHHVAMTYDAAARKATWYFDYAIVGSALTLKTGETGLYIPEGTKFLVGSNGLVSNRNFPGEVDEVRFSNTVLGPAQFMRFVYQSDADEVAVHITFESPSWWGGDSFGGGSFPFATRSPRFSVPYFVSTPGTTAKPVATSDVPAAKIYDSRDASPARTNSLAADMNRTSDAVGSVLKIDYFGPEGQPAQVMLYEEDFTIEFFARFKSQTHVAYTPILTDGLWNFRWGYYDADTGRNLIMQVGTTNTTQQARKEEHVTVTKATSIADGNWHHFALVCKRSTRQVTGFIDYGSFATMSLTLNEGYIFAGETASLVFGGRSVTESSARRLCDIEFDEIRITGRALQPNDFLWGKPKGVTVIFR